MTMNYSYCQSNLLEKPCTYMYTPFQGSELFRSFVAIRVAILRRDHPEICQAREPDQMLVDKSLPALEQLINNESIDGGQMLRAFFGSAFPHQREAHKDSGNILHDLAQSLRNMTTKSAVNTLELLHALAAFQLIEEPDENLKVWIDRLVQRFEVTKKIYEIYPEGFRKGSGSNDHVRLYWLFALVLCLYYTRSKNLKYLNTLLKVCDLLCSLPADMLDKEIPKGGLPFVLAAEVISIYLLAQKKGIPIDLD
ncbi:MAG TPA: hypothetical protein PKY89_01955 [Deltaproteobacteria bacterium]|nr:hypothetical protein [Deltaproteobacteria bacterium]